MSNENIRTLFDENVQKLLLLLDTHKYPCHEIYTFTGKDKSPEDMIASITAEGKKSILIDMNNLPSEGLAKSLGGEFLVRVSADCERHGFFRLFYVIKDVGQLAEFMEHPPWRIFDSYGEYTIHAIVDGRDPANQKVITDLSSISVKKEVAGL